MRYLFKHIVIVFLIISLASCDIASELLTTNHFEQYKEINPFAAVVNADSWDGLGEDEQNARIAEYTAAALSEDNSDELFRKLSLFNDYKLAVIQHYKENVLSVIPDKGLDTYKEDLKNYQINSMALARIIIYTEEATAVTGFNNLFMSFLSGEEESSLNQEQFISKVFMIEDLEDEYTNEEVKELITKDLFAAYSAGEVFNNLGLTITDTDNPTATAVTDKDGVIILLSSMINRIVSLNKTIDNSALDIIDELTSYILNYTANDVPDTFILFPNDPDAPKIADQSLMEHYLGIGGALTYTATGFELPSVTILEGI